MSGIETNPRELASRTTGGLAGLFPGEGESVKSKIQVSVEEVALAQVFSGEKGQVVLQFLRDMTIERPVAMSDTQFPTDGGMHTHYMNLREGENRLVRKIQSIIKKVKQYGG